jgi:hypothetical protein
VYFLRWETVVWSTFLLHRSLNYLVELQSDRATVLRCLAFPGACLSLPRWAFSTYLPKYAMHMVFLLLELDPEGQIILFLCTTESLDSVSRMTLRWAVAA